MWQLVPGQSLRHRGWNDEFVVYNDLSGDTHLLGADAMGLLRLLKAGPRHEQALHDVLFRPDAGADPDAERACLGELLHMLRVIALIGQC